MIYINVGREIRGVFVPDNPGLKYNVKFEASFENGKLVFTNKDEVKYCDLESLPTHFALYENYFDTYPKLSVPLYISTHPSKFTSGDHVSLSPGAMKFTITDLTIDEKDQVGFRWVNNG
jgi:hypothetical protein